MLLLHIMLDIPYYQFVMLLPHIMREQNTEILANSDMVNLR